MWRGTTPTHVFTLPNGYSSSDFSEVYVTYSQEDCRKEDAVVLEKTGDSVQATSTGFQVTLTQQDTLKFKAGSVKVQIRAKLTSGDVIASDIITTSAKDVLKDGVI